MREIRIVGRYELNEGNLAAKGLFNVFDSKTQHVSMWFGIELKDELELLNDEAFVEACKLLCVD